MKASDNRGGHKQSIGGSNHATQMPHGISNFNHSASAVANNLMNLNARQAFQNSINQLAKTYSGLQQDAKGGNYDTSQMDGMLQGYGDNVDAVKMPETKDVTSETLGNDKSGQSGDAKAGAVQQQSFTLIVAEPAPPPAGNPVAPVDPNLARVDEQVIPNISQALQRDEGKIDALANGGPGAVSDRTGVDLLGAPAQDSMPVVFAGAGDRKNEDFNFNLPDPVALEKRHAAPEDQSFAASAPVTSGPDAAPAAVAASPDAPAAEEDLAAQAARSLGLLGKAEPPKSKPLAKAALPASLLKSVKRVQGGPGDAPAALGKWGRVRELTKTLFGPRLSSFFQPLDFPTDRKPASLSGDNPDLWWQALALPFLFTMFFSGLVWFAHSRQNRRLLQQRAALRASGMMAGGAAIPPKKRA